MTPFLQCLAFCAFIVPVITLGPMLSFTGNPETIIEHFEPLTLTCSFKVSDNKVYEDIGLEARFLYILHETKRTIASISKGQPVAKVQYPGYAKVQGQIYDSKDLKESFLQVTWKNPKLSESGKYFCLAHASNSTGQDVVIDASITINVSRSTMEDLASAVSRLRDRADQNEERETQNRKRIMRLEGDFNVRVANLSLLLNKQFETATEIEESTVTPEPINAPCKPGFKKVKDGPLFACLWTSPFPLPHDGAREDCKGEPNNANNEDCVEYSPEKHGLNDVLCSDTKYVICEQPF